MYVRLRSVALCVLLLSLGACGSTRLVFIDPAESDSATPSTGHLADSLLVLEDMPKGYEQGPVPKSRPFCGHHPDPAPVERADAFFAGLGKVGPVGVRTGLRRFATGADAHKEFEVLRTFLTDSCHRDESPDATVLLSVGPGPTLGEQSFVITEVITLKHPTKGEPATQTVRIDAILTGSMIVQVGVLAAQREPDLLDRMARLQLERLTTPWGQSV